MKHQILLIGEGGQGVQTIASALTIASSDQGFYATYIPSFGVEQRGAPSTAFVIISSEEIFYPRFEIADIAVILSERSIKKIANNLSINTKIIFDSSVIDYKHLKQYRHTILGTPATKVANENYHTKSYNIIIFGALTKMLNIDESKGWGAILKVLSHKFSDKNILKLNQDAYSFGRDIVFETKEFSEASFKQDTRIIINKSKDKKSIIDPNYCKGCMICVLKCPTKALTKGDDFGVFLTPTPKIDLEKCIVCGNCRRFCPDGAIGVDRIK